MHPESRQSQPRRTRRNTGFDILFCFDIKDFNFIYILADFAHALVDCCGCGSIIFFGGISGAIAVALAATQSNQARTY